MALENEIRREDIGYRLSKSLELKGQGTPVLQLDSVVVPMVLVGDLTKADPLDYQVTRWCRGRGSSPAGAAFGKLSFNNQVDSGILVKVYQIDVWVDPAMAAGLEIGIVIETASAGGTQINLTKGFTDSRLSHGSTGLLQPARLPTVDIRFDNSGGLAGHWIRAQVGKAAAGGFPFHVNLGGWVLRPGTRLHFEATDINTEFNASVEWTESNL